MAFTKVLEPQTYSPIIFVMAGELATEIALFEKKNPHLVGDSDAIAKALAKRLRIDPQEALAEVTSFNDARTQELLAQGPEELLKILRDENLKRSRSTGMLRVCALLILVLFVASVAYNVATKKDLDLTMLSSIGTLFGSGLVMGASANHKLTASAAAQLHDPRLIGPLLELLDSGDPALTAEIRRALLVLLPKVSEEDAFELSPPQRHALVTWLANEKDASSATVIVGALRWLGDLAATDVLENAANGLSPAISKKDEKLRNHARMAVGELRLRLAKQRVLAEPDRTSEIELKRAQLPLEG